MIWIISKTPINPKNNIKKSSLKLAKEFDVAKSIPGILVWQGLGSGQ
jgi:hypothetical protein